MLYCPYLLLFEGTLQKDLCVHLCGIQGCHISPRNLDFVHTREICFLSNSIKNCFNSMIQRKHYVFLPQEMCSLPLNTKHFTVWQSWSIEMKNTVPCASASQTSPQPHQNFPHQLDSFTGHQQDGDAMQASFSPGLSGDKESSYTFSLLHSSQAELRCRTKPQLLHTGYLHQKSHF